MDDVTKFTALVGYGDRASRRWEEVDEALATDMTGQSLAMSASNTDLDSVHMSKEVKWLLKSKPPKSRNRSSFGDVKVAPRRRHSRHSLKIQVPPKPNIDLEDMNLETEIEGLYNGNRATKRQFVYGKDSARAFKDSAIYMEDDFRREASKESPLGSDDVGETYDEASTYSLKDDNPNSSSVRRHPWANNTPEAPQRDEDINSRVPTKEQVTQSLTPDEHTVQSSLVAYDKANEPYARGHTPPYDELPELESCYEDHSSDAACRVCERHVTISERSVIDLNTFESPLSPPTPRWPSSPPIFFREPTPPTPRWPGTPVSIKFTDMVAAAGDSSANDQEKSISALLNINRAAAMTDQDQPPHPGNTEIVSAAQDTNHQKKSIGELHNLSRAAAMTNQDQPAHPDTTSVAQTEPLTQTPVGRKRPWVTPFSELRKKYPLPEKFKWLDDLPDSSEDSEAEDGTTLPKSTTPPASSPSLPRAQFSTPSGTPARGTPSRWINIVPPATGSSSPMSAPSPFVIDKNGRAHFRPHDIPASPTQRDIMFGLLSPTGLAEMQESRRRFKEAEEKKAREQAEKKQKKDRVTSSPSTSTGQLNFRSRHSSTGSQAVKRVPASGTTKSSQDTGTLISDTQTHPNLKRKASTFNSPKTFPSTPTGVRTPLSSTPSAPLDPDIMAARLLASMKSPSTPLVQDNTFETPKQPHILSSTAAIGSRMPTEAPASPTPIRKPRGRPRKVIDPNAPTNAPKTTRKTPSAKAPRKTKATQADVIEYADAATGMSDGGPPAKKQKL